METRAAHVLIGAFTLAIGALLIAFILWIVKAEVDTEFDTYNILFDGAVSGLGDASTVQYKGVKVGEISSIGIYEKDPTKIRVQVRVDALTPVFRDTVAKIEYQGVTGVGFIQILGGTPESGPPRPQSDLDDPVIQSEDSDIAQLLSNAPAITAQILQLLQEMQKILSPENVQSISAVMKDISTVTGSVAERAPEIGQMIANFNELAENLNVVSEQVAKLTSEEDGSMGSKVDQIVDQLMVLSKNYAELGDTLNQTIQAAQPGVNSGAAEMGALVVELRSLVAALDRTISRMEQNPTRYLLKGSEGGEYKPR